VEAQAASGAGLPEGLKAGVEALSGLAMDDVHVHRNSPEPAKLGALAYAQGSDIHLGPGQERHLPHEAWHVVQQKQGRVKATQQMKGAEINDDPALEAEADRLGLSASSMSPARSGGERAAGGGPSRPVLQRMLVTDAKEDVAVLTWGVKHDILVASGGMFPVGETWAFVQDAIDDDQHRTIQELTKELVAKDLLQFRVATARQKSSPHTSNPMPKVQFSAATQAAVPIAEGQHRRHVIGRHTLGQAVNRSKDDDKYIIDFLERHHRNIPKGRAQLKIEAYKALQDHVGNLWAGHGGENTAIGFYTAALYNWAKDLFKSETALLKEHVDSLQKLSIYSAAKDAWEKIKYVLVAYLYENSVSSENDQNILIISRDSDLIETITEMAKSCEIDLPQSEMDKKYNVDAMNLFNSFSTSNAIFSDTTADAFMRLDWKTRVASAGSAAASTGGAAANGGGGGASLGGATGSGDAGVPME
jgi:hypothetical protein